MSHEIAGPVEVLASDWGGGGMAARCTCGGVHPLTEGGDMIVGEGVCREEGPREQLARAQSLTSDDLFESGVCIICGCWRGKNHATITGEWWGHGCLGRLARLIIAGKK